MTTEPWTTKLQRILEKGVSDNDVFIVRLLTIDKTGQTPDIKINVYSARLLTRNRKIEWQINDNCGNFLVIEENADSECLGRLDIKDDENDRSYVIISCFKYQYESKRNRYLIVDKLTQTPIAGAQTKREASLIMKNMSDVDIETKYIKINS